jgi:hypothetical protein
MNQPGAFASGAALRESYRILPRCQRKGRKRWMVDGFLKGRRPPKVWLHVALSLLVMNAAAVINATAGLAAVRKCVAA